MGAIQNDQGAPTGHFQAAGPPNRGQPFTDSLIRDLQAFLHKQCDGPQHQSCVVDLVFAEKTHPEPGPTPIRAPAGKTAVFFLSTPDLLADSQQGHALLGGLRFNDPERSLLPNARHHARPRLDNAGLFPGNLRQRAAQIFGMFQAHGGDNGGQGMDHVGRVIPPAHSGLDHGHIDVCKGKMVKRHGRGTFEECGGIALGINALHGLGGFHHLFVTDGVCVDLNPFVEPNKVW